MFTTEQSYEKSPWRADFEGQTRLEEFGGASTPPNPYSAPSLLAFFRNRGLFISTLGVDQR